MADEQTAPQAPELPKDAKTYSLTSAEQQLLRATHEQLMNIITNILSTFAIQRLAHNVTVNTNFKLNATMSEVTIFELAPPEAPAEDTGVVGA